MSDKEMLSQEEIDALLNQGNDEDEEPSGELSVDDFLSALEQDALGEVGNISLGSASTALAALVNRKVDITTPKVDIIDLDHLEDEFPHPHVAVHVEYTDGFKGTNLLVIQQDDAKIIADLMMGGEGVASEDDLSDMHISAVQEAMNQMMGSAATSMSTIFNKMVNISPPGIDVLDVKKGKAPSFEDNVIVKVSFRLKVGELIDSSIMQLLPMNFAKELVAGLMNGDQEAEETVEPNGKNIDEEAPPKKENPPISAQESPNLGQAAPSAGGQKVQRSNQANVQSVQFSPLDLTEEVLHDEQNLNLLMDIPLNVTVELGRTKKQIREILELAPGSIIELDKLAGEPVDILVNNKLVAKGEVVVIDENFGVRVTDIISKIDRVQKLQ